MPMLSADGYDSPFIYGVFCEPNYLFDSTVFGRTLHDDADALNYTLYGVAPDNSQYPLCTTLYYYGYKPSANTKMLTVEPQATQETQPTKTSRPLRR